MSGDLVKLGYNCHKTFKIDGDVGIILRFRNKNEVDVFVGGKTVMLDIYWLVEMKQ